MSSMLQNLIGGERRAEHEDFVNRYEQGAPWEGISDDEARSRHDEIAGQLDDDEYELSAQEAYARLEPDQRRELARMLRQQGSRQNVDWGEHDADDDERDADPRELARMTRKARKQKPDMMSQLLGGGGGGGGLGGLMGGGAAKGALAGIAATAAKRFLSR